MHDLILFVSYFVQYNAYAVHINDNIVVIVTIKRRGLRYRTLPVNYTLAIILFFSLVLFGIIHFQ